MHTDMERIVPAAGAYNIRDLGGYATKDGRTTRWGAMFRADGLHRLSEDDKRLLEDRGVRTVVDLRHARELEAKRNAFADSETVEYVHISLLNPATPGVREVRDLGDLYLNLLDGAQGELRLVFETLAAAPGSASLFHCAAGKDRTGVVAGLLLDLAGVPHEVIADDYALTATCIAPILEELREGRPAGMSGEAYERFLESEPEYMLRMLRHLDAEHGGAEGYLRAIGLAAADIARLRAKLLEN
ncbi:tyrosine-protein phosphatase [Paenibacillus sp.]|uniref:tyrosine-protein phosphatase n=1 Tax=Paenibacillus sp. TaxID=58172 RepID=UPI002811857B|nr:tyrosine-protein phosphatase [Paenibacillus sp.]